MKDAKAELLEFVKTEKNIAIDFVEKAKSSQKDIYLYGAGNHLLFAVGFMRKYGLRIKAILDSNRSGVYQGNPCQGFPDGNIPVIKFDDFLSKNDVSQDCWFVVAAPSAKGSIRENIAKHFPLEHVFSFEVELYVDYFSLQNIEYYRSYLTEHLEEFLELYGTLCDDKSRETLVSVLRGRLSGRLDYFQQCFVPDQYFPPDIIRLSKGEVMVELGAYDGQTLLEFIRRCPDYQAAYCFEPDVNLLPVLSDIQNKQTGQGKRVHIIPKGAWDRSTTLELSVEGTATGGTHILDGSCRERGYTIETAAVDDVVHEPVSYIKMDIEGAEMKALHGAEKQIKANHPKLAVCVYHKHEDILDVWNYLRSLVPEYQFYLRHHTAAGAETVLYAVPIN